MSDRKEEYREMESEDSTPVGKKWSYQHWSYDRKISQGEKIGFFITLIVVPVAVIAFVVWLAK